MRRDLLGSNLRKSYLPRQPTVTTVKNFANEGHADTLSLTGGAAAASTNTLGMHLFISWAGSKIRLMTAYYARLAVYGTLHAISVPPISAAKRYALENLFHISSSGVR